jgi:hypothetical protein
VADELFLDTQTGRLWLSEEEEEAPELKVWRDRFSKPLLHHLMAKRNMTLQQVGGCVSGRGGRGAPQFKGWRDRFSKPLLHHLMTK